MLPALYRLRRSEEFDLAVRGGVRAGRNCVVVHMTRATGDHPARAGLVVSKAVGNSVVRSKVKRRIREALRPMMHELAPGTLLVVRALPASAATSWAQLQSQVSSGVRQCEEKWRTRSRAAVRAEGTQP